GRMKTGTTPRVNRNSIDYSTLERQDSSAEPLCFSFWNEPRPIEDPLAVYVTHTNEETHRIIRENLHRSANYNGLIEGIGPRHCPSLESKIVRFPDRKSHKVFLEPEGRETAEVYLQGIYTAFSPEIQESIVHSIEGLEEAQIERYGYDIEYDYVDPIQLAPTLEVDGIKGLFLAGQINGTTGYEEAAGQGLLAGINAARKVLGKESLVIPRERAFIGVMIDDLVTKGITEPYRMLPSRAEYRISLREGNADLRLTRIGYEIGLIDGERYEAVEEKRRRIERLLKELKSTRIGPSDPINRRLMERGSSPLADNGASLFELLRRPEIRLDDLLSEDGIPDDVRAEVEIEGKYAGYLAQHRSQIERQRRMEEIPIPPDLDYGSITNLSIEARELLSRVRPATFGQATRVPGISQADLSILAIILRC
ncbi:MAG TPA: tRNA uridine-5-carboxymethylaminomethyl(34) synthesis enzyme MnmG, partial [Candidatus Acetothermia bacterium]|nr:tRNA uridine-5-carboxymethylaminomethyl(34) synthesis enzyme MnmG [Candidatus Acetothermia bacterium]